MYGLITVLSLLLLLTLNDDLMIPLPTKARGRNPFFNPDS